MITFFPSLIVALLYCSAIKTDRLRHVVQAIVVFIYAMLGAMYT